MTWRKNPREVTDEHFSDGTTIDGNRIDKALGDVVDNFNDISYGYLRKRWVPVTYVAGWSPQSPESIDAAGETGLDPDAPFAWLPEVPPLPANQGDELMGGLIAPTHRWPWLRVRNFAQEVADGTLGSSLGDDVVFSNPYRLKGVRVGGIDPFGGTVVTPGVPPAQPEQENTTEPIGAQFAWTRSWFISPPSILDAIDLVLTVDQTGGLSPPGAVYTNGALDDLDIDLPANLALVISASVDSEFDREDRNMSDVEVLRRGFNVSRDQISPLPLPPSGAGVPAYDDFVPMVNEPAGPFGSIGLVGATTAKGVHVRLSELNIPVHQGARVRISVVIPRFDPAGSAWGELPWLMQKVDMTVTMLEEVTRG